MKIGIIPIVETQSTNLVEKAEVERRSPRGSHAAGKPFVAQGQVSFKSIEPIVVVPESTTTLEDIFARFLQMEVGDGATSTDTIRSYLSVTKQYLNW